MTTHRLIRITCAFALVAGTMTSAACDETPPPIVPSSPSSNASGSWELSGVAVGDDGRPIANAPVWIGFGYPREPVRTDDMGRYSDTFVAREGGYSYRSTALVYLNAGIDYEPEYRLFRPIGSNRKQTLNLHPRVIRYIAVGETVSVTVASDDQPCYNNSQDGSWSVASLCRRVRLVVPSDGVLTVEAVSDDLQALRLPLEVDPDPEGQACCYLGNPLTIPVTAGMLLKINVEIVEGTPGRTFKLTTTLR